MPDGAVVILFIIAIIATKVIHYYWPDDLTD